MEKERNIIFKSQRGNEVSGITGEKIYYYQFQRSLVIRKFLNFS